MELREFDDLRQLCEVVDWEAFRPLLRQIFGRSGSGRYGRPRPPVLGSDGYFPSSVAGDERLAKRPSVAVPVAESPFVQAFCGIEERLRGSGSTDDLEV